jgi:hypothetical protein
MGFKRKGYGGGREIYALDGKHDSWYGLIVEDCMIQLDIPNTHKVCWSFL